MEIEGMEAGLVTCYDPGIKTPLHTFIKGTKLVKKIPLVVANILIISFGPGCLDRLGRAKNPGNETDKPFIIAVVGSDVKNRLNDADMNVQQGWAMRAGVEAAYNLKSLEKFRKIVNLKFVNDDNIKEIARIEARGIVRDPRVLAVIGHSNSAMTREAAWFYEQANLPLLMPIATSPSAMFELSEDGGRGRRLRNCFRLPPDDFRGQIRAIAWFVESEKKTRRYIIIDDMTEQAQEYSKNFGKRLASLLGLSDNSILYMSSQAWLQHIQAMLSQKPDVIIFCGYGRSANPFVSDLESELKRASQGGTQPFPPVLVFTDGCKIPKLDVRGFEAYLTFPLPPLEKLPKRGEKVEALKAAFADGDTETYQIYGFDSLYLIADALGLADSEKEPGADFGNHPANISRHSLSAALSSGRKFDGVHQSYSFRDNEVEYFKFYILKIDNGKTSERTKYTYYASVGKDDLSESPSEKNIDDVRD